MVTYKPSDYELLRRRCAQLKETGWKQTKIAQALGLTEGWVSRTLKKISLGWPSRFSLAQTDWLYLSLNQQAVDSVGWGVKQRS